MKIAFHRGALLCAFFIIPTIQLSGQGSLTPPAGTPAPLFKTLQQIEPRIDLQMAPASAVTTTDASYHFIITQTGSYYLSANINVTKNNGIQINAPGVTLDLNGFEIARTAGSGGLGIEIPPTSHRPVIRNGSINGFTSGVVSIFGSGYAKSGLFRDLVVSGCTNTALFAGDGAVVEACRVHGNTGSSGINTGSGSLVINCAATANNVTSVTIAAGINSSIINCSASGNTALHTMALSGHSTMINCSASGNTAQSGIRVSTGCTVSDCTANLNVGTAAGSSGGISVIGEGSTLTRCSARQNTNPIVNSLTGIGIELANNNTLENCLVSANQGDGIKVASSCVVRGNHSIGNGVGGSGAGVHASSDDNLIEGNTVRDNDRGIDVDGEFNVVIKNTAANNTTAYQIAANNRFGPIINISGAGVAAQNVSDASANVGSVMGSTDPWANFLY